MPQSSWLLAVGGVERLSAMTVQVGLTLLVLYSVRSKKYSYLLLAVGLHWLVDFVSVMFMVSFGILVTEISVGLFAVASLVFFGIIMAVVFGSMQRSRTTEPEITIDSQNLVISGAFGVTQPLSGIRNVELKEDAPVDTYKTNGLGIDDIRRGSFDVQGLGNGKLYVHLSQKPFIYITTDNSFIIINFKNSTRTQQLYDEIIKNWKAG